MKAGFPLFDSGPRLEDGVDVDWEALDHRFYRKKGSINMEINGQTVNESARYDEMGHTFP